MNPNVYLPYPSPQNTSELNEDVAALLNQPGVPLQLFNEYNAVMANPQTQVNIDEAEANSDSMSNE